MASAIDPTKPVEGNPTTQSVRENFAAAKSEIEVLQQTAGVGPQGPAGTITSASANTLEPGTNASVTLGGTPSARTFTFGIPRGNVGPQGPIGTPGQGTGGAGLTQGGAVGAKLVKTGAANYVADWFGTSEDVPMVETILNDGLNVTLLLDRPAPANAWVQFWRLSRRTSRMGSGSSSDSGVVRRYGNRVRRAFRPHHDGSGGPMATVQIPAGQRQVSFHMQAIYWSTNQRDRWAPWHKRLSNPYWQVNPQGMNARHYRFSVRVMGTGGIRSRKSKPSAETLVVMQWMNRVGDQPQLIARVF